MIALFYTSVYLGLIDEENFKWGTAVRMGYENGCLSVRVSGRSKGELETMIFGEPIVKHAANVPGQKRKRHDDDHSGQERKRQRVE